MKKFLLSVATAMMCAAGIQAQTTVKTLYTGTQAVTWENTLSLDAAEFADVNVGDYIYITFFSTTDVIELKSDGTWLPGSQYTWLGDGVPNYKSYITADGLRALQSNGLELCGASFTVTGVSIMNDGFVMPEGAVWGGYFWVSEWDTLEIWETAFSNYNGEKYMVINISDENADNTNYVMQVMTQFDNDAAVIGNAAKGNETKTNKMTVIDLSSINMTDVLALNNKVFVQGNPEGGNAFNITSVVLTNTNPLESGAVESLTTSDNVSVYTLQGVMMKTNVKVSEALIDLPKGIYVVNGENGAKKVVK